MILGRTLESWCATYPLIRELVALQETTWFNPGVAPVAQALGGRALEPEKSTSLSVGTVLAAAPRILILDEPTFGQDAVTWAAVVDLLAEQVQRGRCVVVVTHDPRVAAACDRRWHLVDGELAPQD